MFFQTYFFKTVDLTLDDHHSHQVTGLLQRTRENIHVITLPPHSAESVLWMCHDFPLKRSYSKAMTKWMAKSSVNAMSNWVWPKSFGKIYTAVITVGNMISECRLVYHALQSTCNNGRGFNSIQTNNHHSIQSGPKSTPYSVS